MNMNGQFEKGEISLISVIIGGIFIIALIIAGFLFGPVYVEKHDTAKVLRGFGKKEFISQSEAQRQLFVALSVSGINIAADDIIALNITPTSNNQYRFALSWKKRVPLFGGKTVVFKFHEDSE